MVGSRTVRQLVGQEPRRGASTPRDPELAAIAAEISALEVDLGAGALPSLQARAQCEVLAEWVHVYMQNIPDPLPSLPSAYTTTYTTNVMTEYRAALAQLAREKARGPRA